MKILYLGTPNGTSGQRSAALVRLGHEVLHLDPEIHLPKNRFALKLHFETGGILCRRPVTQGVLAEVRRHSSNPSFDVALVNGGRYVGPGLIAELRKYARKVVNYNNDDPYGSRDRYSWASYRLSVPHYDLVVVVRGVNVPEAKAWGAKDALFVKMSGDEVAHRPRDLTPADIDRWTTDVVFIGTWMPERGPFMRELISRKVPLAIYGSQWHKAADWSKIQPYWKGAALSNSDDYSRALQCSKVALGLLSRGNRDMHTQRSTEIPAVGALLCAERTPEHEAMYQDGAEAIFWSNATECAKVCQELLQDEARRKSIVRKGAERARRNGTFNEPTMKLILERTFSR